MASILAIVSKKVFERDFRAGGKPAALGDVVPTTTYASAHPSLGKLADGGDMFLVTVAPGEQLWLAGILVKPKFAKDRWVATPSSTAITNITTLIPRLAFETGKGLTAKPGALGISLQTPRTLTDEDVALLRGAVGGNAAKAASTKRTLTDEDVALLRGATGGKAARAANGAPTTAKASKGARAAPRTAKPPSTKAAPTSTRKTAPTSTRKAAPSSTRKAAPTSTREVAKAAPTSTPKAASTKAAPTSIRKAPKAASTKAAPTSTRKAASTKAAPTSTRKAALATRTNTAPTRAAPTSAARLGRATIVPKGSTHLARAAEFLDGGALVDALDELLRAWAQHKAAELADLIDDLGAHIAKALPAIAGNKKTIDAAWRDVGDQRRPADVPRLLAAFDAGSSTQLEGWLDVLDLFPIDPRLCAAAVDTSVKFVASSAGPTRTRANRLAEKIADGRCLPQIDKLIAKKSNAWNATELRDRLRKLKTKFTPPPVLAKEDKAAVAALAKTIAKLPPADAVMLVRVPKQADDDGARLLAEVLADPEAEAPRLVYMDWLQQHGDPRGELIALQLQGGNEARVKQLVKQHSKSWLGPLAAIVSEPVFERGFLAACEVTLHSEKQRALLAHPLWATVERITTQEAGVVESPAMKSLRTVRGLAISDLAQLSRRREPLAIERLEKIALDFSDGDEPHWKALYEVGAFTKLHALGIDFDWSAIDEHGAGFDAWRWLVEGKLGKQLTRLHLDFSDVPDVPDWMRAFEASSTLETLGLVPDGESVLQITRTGKTFAFRYDLLVKPKTTDDFEWRYGTAATELFEGFPLKTAPRLDVTLHPLSKAADVAHAQAFLAGHLAKHFETIAVTAR